MKSTRSVFGQGSSLGSDLAFPDCWKVQVHRDQEQRTGSLDLRSRIQSSMGLPREQSGTCGRGPKSELLHVRSTVFFCRQRTGSANFCRRRLQLETDPAMAFRADLLWRRNRMLEVVPRHWVEGASFWCIVQWKANRIG